MQLYSNSRKLASRQPANPVFCLRPQQARASAGRWIREFPGQVLYAVKANTNPLLLNALYQGGVRHFDVTSPAELEKLRPFSETICYNMNPVKHPQNIRDSYFGYGVRAFALDSLSELRKIRAATHNASDLDLFVRIAVENPACQIPLDRKFGADGKHAVALLVATQQVARRIGISFHVGSQCLSPMIYGKAVQTCDRILRESGVKVDFLDTGGGFPAPYPGTRPPPLNYYINTIARNWRAGKHTRRCALMCEPGRSLVADACSILVSITLRRNRHLYITDGAYGALFDAAHLGLRHPVALHRIGPQTPSAQLLPFELFGPTCDSIDHMPGPFFLPADCREGDYMEIGLAGAYAEELVTGFNGFARYEQALIADPFPDCASAAAEVTFAPETGEIPAGNSSVSPCNE